MTNIGARIITGIRIRGALANELECAQKASAIIQQVDDSNSVVVDDEKYTFDFVLGPSQTQNDVFRHIGVPILNDCFDGFNGTGEHENRDLAVGAVTDLFSRSRCNSNIAVFAYGQTGSGKSYTMLGENGLVHQ
jgi:kinesin family protein 15